MVNPHLYHDRVTLKKILSLMVPLFISGNNSALAAEKSAINDDIIIITGKAEATGITEDSKMYNTSSMSTATGLNLSARETPQSVSVLTKQRMLDQILRMLPVQWIILLASVCGNQIAIVLVLHRGNAD